MLSINFRNFYDFLLSKTSHQIILFSFHCKHAAGILFGRNTEIIIRIGFKCLFCYVRCAHLDQLLTSILFLQHVVTPASFLLLFVFSSLLNSVEMYYSLIGFGLRVHVFIIVVYVDFQYCSLCLLLTVFYSLCFSSRFPSFSSFKCLILFRSDVER